MLSKLMQLIKPGISLQIEQDHYILQEKNQWKLKLVEGKYQAKAYKWERTYCRKHLGASHKDDIEVWGWVPTESNEVLNFFLKTT